MFNSPLEFCPRSRQYVALDSTPTDCAPRSRCGGGFCPLEPYFTGTQMCPAPAASARENGRPGDVSPAATSLLCTMARGGQVEFSSADLEQLLHKPEGGIKTIVDELRKRGLMQLADATEEAHGYELTEAGRRYIAEQVSRTQRATGGSKT